MWKKHIYIYIVTNYLHFYRCGLEDASRICLVHNQSSQGTKLLFVIICSLHADVLYHHICCLIKLMKLVTRAKADG